MGLDDYYHNFAVVLETNGVSPHQVLLDAGIDDFAHHNAGHALTAAAAKFPMISRGISLLRAVFLSVSLLLLSSGLDPLLFSTRWSAPFIWRS